jgi:hypothetical protein
MRAVKTSVPSRLSIERIQDDAKRRRIFVPDDAASITGHWVSEIFDEPCVAVFSRACES